MSEGKGKQVSIRFSEEEWNRILVEASKFGLKPAQYVRTCVIQRLNGILVDAGTIDEILVQDRVRSRPRY